MSAALNEWNGASGRVLDAIEAAHGRVGQWVLLGPGEFAIEAKVIESRGTIGYDKEPAFLLLIPAEGR